MPVHFRCVMIVEKCYNRYDSL
ncbi:unnamed protein product [Spirodela intermedia]|uniref:Uncharacterized protein n=2 Tax=Spirodela intermedia TaxID=51605 RepID=A0A7I8JCX1_SPIIN|nr:unnamed protein product [Spirodela intermedia]CAA6668008.1 unnamed protein product [Spirodela intermedia]CAA7404833.1 unnamed protein product [Spirodela intermedia]